MSNNKKNKLHVCSLDVLRQKTTMSWNKMVQDQQKACLIIYIDEQLYTYVNSCPHTGVNLDWKPHEFLSNDGLYIQCAMHGALFNIKNGLCLHGPCLGEGLEPIKSEIIDGQIYVYL